MTTNCVNTPFDLGPLRAQRNALLADLRANGARWSAHQCAPPAPMTVYALLFGEHLHPAIVRRVRSLYDRVASNRRRAVRPGYLYVFHDERDGAVVKIGSTVNVERRLDEWCTQLGTSSLRLLCTVYCADVRFTESLVHALLFCAWQPKRVNVHTNRRALEYFAVAPRAWEALHALCIGAARHSSWFIAQTH